MPPARASVRVPAAVTALLALGAGCAASVPAPTGAPATAAAASPAARAAPAAALRVMTFNVRYGTAPDGDDAWPRRSALALAVIRDFDPALLGLQEALRFQLDEIARALPHVGEVGVGRDDGAAAGEYAAILYDRRRLALLEQGRFWLSDTPEVPGSMTWGNRYPRIVTWARFADRLTGATFHAFDTHWDHESQLARARGADLMAQRIAAARAATDAGGAPVIVTGDFNSAEDNPAFQSLLRSTGLADSFRAVHPSATEVGTFHAFHGERGGAKIDAILTSTHWRALDAAIVHTGAVGHYPSDHFPVTATLLLP